MRSDICPSFFYITPDRDTTHYNEDDIFKPNEFKIFQAENLTRIKKIVAHTAIDKQLQVRLLCCYRMKDLPETYCLQRYNNFKKQVCSQEFGIQTVFIHFHIKLKNENNVEYLLAFIEGSDLQDNAGNLVKEMFSSMTWLDIKSHEIYLNIFTYGSPVYGVSNKSHLDELIDSEKNRVIHNYKLNVDYKITHINKDAEDRLSVSLRSGNLIFTPSND